jgi:hypothetical protein
MSSPETSRLHEWFFDRTGRTFSRVQKITLLIGIAFTAALAVLAGKLLHVPLIRGFSASILQNSSAVAGITTVALTLIGGVIVCTFLARTIRPDAGIFCAALGLVALRLQGGATRHALLQAGGRTGFLTLAAELAILAGFLLIAFASVRALVRKGTVPDDSEADGATLRPEKIDQQLLGSAAMTFVFIVGMLVLCKTDWPMQAMASVFLMAILSAWCAFRFVPTSPSVWYWIGPILAGFFGYLYCWQAGYADAVIGQPAGFFAALARPMPLDYAGLGVTGALMGYWIARRQQHDREHRESDEGNVIKRAV